MSDAQLDWIPWDFMRWLSSCEGMPGQIELVYFRLIMHAYKDGTGFVSGSEIRLAAKCKVQRDELAEALEFLAEDGKIERMESGVHIPSVTKRIEDALDKLEANRSKTAAARDKATAINALMRERGVSKADARKLFDQGNTVVPAAVNGSDEPDGVISAAEVREIWNEYAARLSLPEVSEMTDGRLKAVRKRLTDHKGFQGMEGAKLLRFACENIQYSAFLLGKNDRNWRMNFDTLVRPDRFAKLLEGGYSDGGVQAHADKSETGQLQKVLREL